MARTTPHPWFRTARRVALAVDVFDRVTGRHRPLSRAERGQWSALMLSWVASRRVRPEIALRVASEVGREIHGRMVTRDAARMLYAARLRAVALRDPPERDWTATLLDAAVDIAKAGICPLCKRVAMPCEACGIELRGSRLVNTE